MHIDGKPQRTIWLGADGKSVEIIDQTKLPHRYEIASLTNLKEAGYAIKEMQVRGAPLIGATAAYGMCLSLLSRQDDDGLLIAGNFLKAQRPTAVNLAWAVDLMTAFLLPIAQDERLVAAFQKAAEICDQDVETNRALGEHGVRLIEQIARQKNAGRTGYDKKPVNILTHCNAGWLATVDWGTATSPIYRAHNKGIAVHVWVDETRPRNQGASLTAYELGHEGVPHTIITDNAGGHLMQHGDVDIVIVGTDRTASNGDVCNKIGTYLKALAAHDNQVPFYVALPSSTIDWTLKSGFDIPIEGRGQEEVLQMSGRLGDEVVTIDIAAKGSPAFNPAFDVTPAKYVTKLITERGLCDASEQGLKTLFGLG